MRLKESKNIWCLVDKKIYFNMEMKYKKISFVIFIIGALSLISCNTGVESSKNPGTIRVIIQADPSDTSISIANKTHSVGDDDGYMIKFVQGKIYDGDNYFILYKNKSTYVQEDIEVNILEKDGNDFKKYKVFETLIPAGSYSKLQFGLTGSEVTLGNLIIPLVLPEDQQLLMDFNSSIEIKENTITEINLIIKPFQSVERFQDNFLFIRDIQISSINYLNE